MALVSAGLLGAPSATPSPSPAPVFELHRTAAAAHSDPFQVNPLFVLVVGSDVREGDPERGRADSLHLISLNTSAMRGTILGIPRDVQVDIPGQGPGRINSALQHGGINRLVEAVSKMAGVPIHYWALTEFTRFRKLVDDLGGLEVTVPYPITEPLSGANFPAAGPRRMGGVDALAFARVRYGIPGGDFGRTLNQGTMLQAALASFQSGTRDPKSLLRWLKAFRAHVHTDVPVKDLVKLAKLGLGIHSGAMANAALPAVPGSAGGASVAFLAPEAGPMLQNFRDDGML